MSGTISHTRPTRSRFVVGMVASWPLLSLPAAAQPIFEQVNLVTNNQAAHAATIQDANLINPWGISFTATSPFWVSDNGTGLSSLYKVDSTTDTPSLNLLVVTIPGDGTPTGQVFNSGTATGAFNGDNFLFVSEDGTVSGWRGALGTSAETLALASPSNVYKGSAIAAVGGHTYLYAANFKAGRIDIYKGDAGAPDLAGSFADPNLPAGFAPFNIQNLNGTLYVTYAKQDVAGQDDVAGAGNGIVDAFDLNGTILGRIASNGSLNSPWGLAIAPASFDGFSGDLLVGNSGDGTISVFDLVSKGFVGQLSDAIGDPLSIDGLWGITVGNGANAGSLNELYFAAGPDDGQNGLFGVIKYVSGSTPGSVPEPATLALLGVGLAGLAAARQRSR
jgi:uncharacterized protein (TIGR03118 family)